MAPPTIESSPTLRFSPYAWAKLIWLRDRGQTEITGFGLGGEQDPLRIEDVILLTQVTTSASVEFEDDAIAEMCDRARAAGIAVNRFRKISIHTHPGNSPTPSSTDETAYKDYFIDHDWSILFILARGGDWYARYRVGRPVPVQMALDVRIDYQGDTRAVDDAARADWDQEYTTYVRPRAWNQTRSAGDAATPGAGAPARVLVPGDPQWPADDEELRLWSDAIAWSAWRDRDPQDRTHASAPRRTRRWRLPVRRRGAGACCVCRSSVSLDELDTCAGCGKSVCEGSQCHTVCDEPRCNNIVCTNCATRVLNHTVCPGCATQYSGTLQ